MSSLRSPRPSLAGPNRFAGICGSGSRVEIDREFGHLAAVKERPHTASGRVNMKLGLEDYVNTLDVVLHVEVFCRLGRLRAYSYLERAETVQTYALGVLQLALHHHHQLTEHSENVSPLDRTVGLNFLRQLVCGHFVDGDGASVPFLILITVCAIVLIKSVKYCHNSFSFLLFLMVYKIIVLFLCLSGRHCKDTAFFTRCQALSRYTSRYTS